MSINDLMSLKMYGVFGYSLAVSLCIAGASVGLAYYRAGRDRDKAFSLIASALLFAVFFGYLVLVSLETGWLPRTILQPIMRTITIVAALSGWMFLFFALHKEARTNGRARSGDSEIFSSDEGG